MSKTQLLESKLQEMRREGKTRLTGEELTNVMYSCGILFRWQRKEVAKYLEAKGAVKLDKNIIVIQ